MSEFVDDKLSRLMLCILGTALTVVIAGGIKGDCNNYPKIFVYDDFPHFHDGQLFVFLHV